MDLALPNSSERAKSVSPLGDLLAPLSKAVNPGTVLAVLAGFLVWTLTQSLLTSQRAQGERIDRIYTMVETMAQQHEVLKQELAGNQRLFRLICVNTSERDSDRRACLTE